MKVHLFNRLFILLSIVFIIQFSSCNRASNFQVTQQTEDLLNYVDPFIGTGFHGHTFPGPVMPHGMVQLSPDTKLNGWDASSGYHYDDNTIYGFSHTHLSGTGIGDMGDILVLPFTGNTVKKPIATFDKHEEKSKIGYYEVAFNNYDVKAKLAVTNRVGMHNYEFGGTEKKRVMLDLGHILQRTWGHDNVVNELEIIDNKTIKGLKHSSGWAYDHKVFFYAEFSSPFKLDTVVVDNVARDISDVYEGKNLYAYLGFEELADDANLQIKISISPVDTDGAQNNMIEELPHWGFKKVRRNTELAWEQELSSIRVTSKNEDQLKIFYTALYHSKIAPMIYQDVDGRYRGMDKEIYRANEQNTNYTVYSLWDTFRALHPLMSIIDEPNTVSWVNNLILKYQQGKLLPMWPLASNYTGTMVGYPAVANIADALLKELPGINQELALEASLNSAAYKPWLVENTANKRKKSVMPLYNKYVNENKHIPADKIIKSVSFGLEMAYYDWCISQIAKVQGKDSITAIFEGRSRNYKQYFNTETGFMRGKNADNSWVEPFNPKFSSHTSSPYVEGNAWQWSWFVPHDVEGLIDLYRGKENFTVKLDSLFTTSSEIEGEDASGDITGLIGQYAHGNEPSHHIAYFYTEAGQSWKTQELVDQILTEFYSSKPDGIIGNEDCGQMSAWYILNAMGFYQVTPGKPVYTIGRPLFDKVEIPLSSETTFTIITENNSADNKYVQEVFLNGKKRDDLFFSHKELKSGSTLKIIMGNIPNKNL